MTEVSRPAAPSPHRCPLSIFHVAAAAAAIMTGLLMFLEPRLAPWPPILIVLACLVAPFIPRLGFFLPVITRGDRTRPAAALTFDDGPDPVTTPLLLNLLARRGARAAFFLIGEKAEQHPDLVRAILAAGHEIGNHSYSHDVFLMLRGPARLKREIARGQDVWRVFGIRPLVFRPPVGITNPLLYGALLEAGMTCVCFRRRPADFGNRRLTGLSMRLTRRLGAGDILLLHEGLPPRAEGGTGLWLAEIEGVLDALAGKGLRAALLSEVIRQPVLESAASAAGEAPDSFRRPTATERMPRTMRPAWKRKLARARFVKRAVAEAAAYDGKKMKPTPRFLIGLSFIGLSNLLTWPLIGLLGILAVRRKQPALFTVGSPIAYGVLSVVFFLGIALAGKEGLRFLRSLVYRGAARFYARHLAAYGDEAGWIETGSATDPKD